MLRINVCKLRSFLSCGIGTGGDEEAAEGNGGGGSSVTGHASQSWEGDGHCPRFAQCFVHLKCMQT